MEKDQDDKNDERNRFEKRLLNFVNRFADGNRRIVNNRVVETARETLLELSHFLSHRIGSSERVRARQLENGDRRCRFSAESTVNGVIAGGELNPRDVAHPSDLTVSAGLNNDVAELFFVSEPALRADRVLKCSRLLRHRRRADDSGCDLHILLLDGRHYILRC